MGINKSRLGIIFFMWLINIHSITFSQDTLVTTTGLEYLGSLIDTSGKYITFRLEESSVNQSIPKRIVKSVKTMGNTDIIVSGYISDETVYTQTNKNNNHVIPIEPSLVLSDTTKIQFNNEMAVHEFGIKTLEGKVYEDLRFIKLNDSSVTFVDKHYNVVTGVKKTYTFALDDIQSFGIKIRDFGVHPARFSISRGIFSSIPLAGAGVVAGVAIWWVTIKPVDENEWSVFGAIGGGAAGGSLLGFLYFSKHKISRYSYEYLNLKHIETSAKYSLINKTIHKKTG